jgi:NO-binding membrane sensor protein with MHYT domain
MFNGYNYWEEAAAAIVAAIATYFTIRLFQKWNNTIWILIRMVLWLFIGLCVFFAIGRLLFVGYIHEHPEELE